MLSLNCFLHFFFNTWMCAEVSIMMWSWTCFFPYILVNLSSKKEIPLSLCSSWLVNDLFSALVLPAISSILISLLGYFLFCLLNNLVVSQNSMSFHSPIFQVTLELPWLALIVLHTLTVGPTRFFSSFLTSSIHPRH